MDNAASVLRAELDRRRHELLNIQAAWACWGKFETWIAGFRPFLRRHFPEYLDDFNSIAHPPQWLHYPAVAGPAGDRLAMDTQQQELWANNQKVEDAKSKLLAFVDSLLQMTPEPPRGDLRVLPIQPYKRFVFEKFSGPGYYDHLAKMAAESTALEETLQRFGGRDAVLASIRRHAPDFDAAEADQANAPAWLRLKPLLVRAGLVVNDDTTLLDIKAFLDSAPASLGAADSRSGSNQGTAESRQAKSNPGPADYNLATLNSLLEASANGANAARWSLSLADSLPKLQMLAERLALCRPGEFSATTVQAIVTRLCVRFDLRQQQAYGLPLSRVVLMLQDLEQRQGVSPISDKEAVMPEPRNVFVIHGRNQAARNAMFDFLQALGLNPIEWGEAVKMTGKGSPYVGEILDAAFGNAQAVVAVLTGDDLAHLREELHGDHELEHETKPTPQPRQNVLFEAGMAFGRHAERTVLVEIGHLRPFSDVVGRHAIRLGGTPEQRAELRERLKTAGCAVKEGGTDWLSRGDFDAALQLTAVSKPTAKRKP